MKMKPYWGPEFWLDRAAKPGTSAARARPALHCGSSLQGNPPFSTATQRQAALKVLQEAQQAVTSKEHREEAADTSQSWLKAPGGKRIIQINHNSETFLRNGTQQKSDSDQSGQTPTQTVFSPATGPDQWEGRKG